MRSIYFQEEHYCQIEILPVENLDYCLEQAKLLNGFSETQLSGAEWANRVMRNEKRLSLHDKRIAHDLFDETMAEIFPKYDQVFTGYNSFHEKCEDTSAFGHDKNVVLFYNEKSGFVRNIWLTLGINKQDDVSAAGHLFMALTKLGDFIIADWGWSFIEKINNTEKMGKYLKSRFDRLICENANQ